MNKWRHNRGKILLTAFSAAAYLASSVLVSAQDYAPTGQSPTVFTYESSAPKVDGVSGAFTQHILLDIPPGRNGAQPDLSLDYNSQNTDQENLLGYGWTLSVPYVARLNKTGSQNLYGTAPYFASSLDGELATAAVTSTSTAAGSFPSPLAYWKLDESSGNAADATDNGYTLTNNNAATYSSAVLNNGLVTSAGSSQYVVNSNFSNVVKSSPITISAWIKIASGGQQLVGIRSTDPGATQTYIYAGLGDNGDLVEFRYQAGGAGTADTIDYVVPSNPFNTWHLYTLTYDGSTLKAYLDGSLVGTDSAHSGYFSGSTYGFYIGKNGDYNSTYFTGSADEVGVWTQALSALQIASLYNSGAAVAYPLAPNGVVTTGPYYARVDDGSFRTYSYATSSNSWIMYDKRGTRYLFGASSQSQQSATTSASQVYKWMLEEVRDTNNNFVRYVYNKDGNQIYPYQIIYTGNGVTDGPATITFATSTRPDTSSGYRAGFRVSTKYRISQITAAFNGSNVRRYDLSYTTGNNSNRSLLSSVQQTGWDENSNAVSLPSMTFGYVSSSTPFVWRAPSAAHALSDSAYIAGSVKGNGLNDVAHFYHNTTTGLDGGDLWINNVTTFASDTISPPDYWSTTCNCGGGGPAERGVRFVDVNGDGKLDVIRGFLYDSTPTNTLYFSNGYSTSTGYTWTSTTTFSGTIPTFAKDGTGSIHGLTTGIFGDVNGTGLPSFEQRVDGYFSGTAYLANGSAWASGTTTVFAPPQSMPTPTGSYPNGWNSQLIDVNGDGLADWVYSDSSNTYVLPNTGTGWESTPDSSWTIGTSTLGSTYYDRGIRFLDLNGDGLLDFIHSYSNPTWTGGPERGVFNQAFLNTGNGWATTTAYSLPCCVASYDASGNPSSSEFASWMGNGQQYQDVLSTITYSKGGSTAATYGYTTQLRSNPQLPYSLLVVTNVVNHDGRGSNESTDYSYSGGLQYLPSNVFDRKFAGFASTTETHSDRTVVSYYNQGNATTTSQGEQSDG
jgi:hypothetical protein